MSDLIYSALVAAVRELLKHRDGDLPTRGNLRDNDASRAALAKLAKLIKELDA